MSSPGAIEVNIPAAKGAYDNIEEKQKEIKTSGQQLEQIVAELPGVWSSAEKAPPFFRAMEDIKDTFNQKIQELNGHIEHSQTDLQRIGGF